MNTDDLLMTIAFQANTIRNMSDMSARLERTMQQQSEETKREHGREIAAYKGRLAAKVDQLKALGVEEPAEVAPPARMPASTAEEGEPAKIG